MLTKKIELSITFCLTFCGDKEFLNLKVDNQAITIKFALSKMIHYVRNY